MNEPGDVEAGRDLRPGLVAGVAVGIALGGWAGATMRGSGMLYTNLFVAALLIVVCAIAGLGALAATLTHQPGAARVLAAFAGVAVVATGVAYSLAPPFRDPNADPRHRGSVTVHVTGPAVIEWSGEAECRTRAHDRTVFVVFMPDVKVTDQWVAVLVNLGPGATSVQLDQLTLAFASPAGSVDYIAGRDGLGSTSVGAGGFTGSSRFSAERVSVASRSPDPESFRLTGTIDWACEATPSG